MVKCTMFKKWGRKITLKNSTVICERFNLTHLIHTILQEKRVQRAAGPPWEDDQTTGSYGWQCAHPV